MMRSSKVGGEREAPCPAGGQRNDKLPDNADGEEEGEQHTDELAGKTSHEFRNMQPRRSICGVERTGGDVAVAHLQ